MTKRSIQIGLAATGLILGATYAAPAFAGITFTMERPSIQTTTRTDDVFVEDFESYATDSYLYYDAQFSDPNAVSAEFANAVDSFGGYIAPANVFGGANGEGNFLQGNATIKFKEAQSYLGFWWSAGDGANGDTRADAGNQIELFSNGQLLQSFSTQSVWDAIGLLPADQQQAYMGNPNANFNTDTGERGNIWEPYAYLNLFGSSGVTFDEVRFLGGWFESDNLAFSSQQQEISGTIVSDAADVPEPTSLISLLVMGGMGLMVRRRQQAF